MDCGAGLDRIEALAARRDAVDADIERLCAELMRFPWPWRWAKQWRQDRELKAVMAESDRVYWSLAAGLGMSTWR